MRRSGADNKWLPPALYFERHQNELLPKVDADTIEHAAALFAAANSQLRA